MVLAPRERIILESSFFAGGREGLVGWAGGTEWNPRQVVPVSDILARPRALSDGLVPDVSFSIREWSDHLRFDVPLYSLGEAAQIVGVPKLTVRNWTGDEVSATQKRCTESCGALLTWLWSDEFQGPGLSFAGLAEALVLTALRLSGGPLSQMRPAIQELRMRIDIPYPLASRRLYADRVRLLGDFYDQVAEAGLNQSRSESAIPSGDRRTFVGSIENYFRLIDYDEDNYACLIRLPAYVRARVVVDPLRSFGQPIFECGGVRVADVIDRFKAGESLQRLEDEFGIPIEQLKDAVRVDSRPVT